MYKYNYMLSIYVLYVTNTYVCAYIYVYIYKCLNY